MTVVMMTKTAFISTALFFRSCFFPQSLCVFLLRKCLVRRSAASFPPVLTHWKMLSTKTWAQFTLSLWSCHTCFEPASNISGQRLPDFLTVNSLKSKTKPCTNCDGGRLSSTTSGRTCWATSHCCSCRGCWWWRWWCRWGCCWGSCCWCCCYCSHSSYARTQPGAVQRFQRGTPLLCDVLPPPPPRLDGGGWGAEADKAPPHPPLPPPMSSPPPPPLLLDCFYSM